MDLSIISIGLGAFLGAVFTPLIACIVKWFNRPKIKMDFVVTGANGVALEYYQPLDQGGLLNVRVTNSGRRSTKDLTVTIRALSKMGIVSLKIGPLHPSQMILCPIGFFKGDRIEITCMVKEFENRPFVSGIILDSLPELLEFTAYDYDVSGVRNVYFIRKDLIIEDLGDSDVPISHGSGFFYDSIPVSNHLEPKYSEITDEKEIKKYCRLLRKKKL